MLRKRLERGMVLFRPPLLTYHINDGNEFDETCKSLLEDFIKASLDKKNPVYYHKCCFSFSSRGHSTCETHPKDQTQTITKTNWKDRLRNVEEFKKFIIEEQGDKTIPWIYYKPLINIPHNDFSESHKLYERDVEHQVLVRDKIPALEAKLREMTASEEHYRKEVAFWF